MKKIFTTILVSVGFVAAVFAQRTATTYKNSFDGPITGGKPTPFGSTQDFNSGGGSTSQIYTLGDVWEIAANSTDALTVSGVNAAGNVWFGIWFSTNESSVDFSSNPIVSVKVTNTSANAATLEVCGSNAWPDGGTFASATIPANSTQTVVLTAVGFNTNVKGLRFQTNPAFTGTLVFDDLLVGISPGVISSISTITGPNVVTRSTNATFREVPLPARTDYTLSWSSSNTAVGTIDQNGVLSGLSNGTTIITATAVQGSTTVTGQKSVTVLGIDIAGVSITGITNISGITQYTSLVSPSNAIQNVRWSVSPAANGLVGADGRLLPIKNGVLTVTATSVEDPSKSASMVVKVDGQEAGPANLSGYVFENFTTLAETGLSFSGPSSLVTLTGFNFNDAAEPTPLTMNLAPTTGGFGAGFEAYFLNTFLTPTTGSFDENSFKVKLSVESSQAVPLSIYVTNVSSNIFDNAGRVDVVQTITAGVGEYTFDFAGKTNTGFNWGGDLQFYIVYNVFTGSAKPAGTLKIGKIAIGTQTAPTSFVLTTTGIEPVINTFEGSVNISAILSPSTAAGAFTYTLVSDPATGVASYNNATQVLQALGVNNGTVTLTGTSVSNPSLSSSIIVAVTGNSGGAPCTLANFDLTFTGTAPSLTAKVINVSFTGTNCPTTIGGVTYSVSPVNIASINSTTGVMIVSSVGGVVTVTAVSGSVTETYTLTIPGTSTGISSSLSASEFSVAPNPASDVVSVSAPVAVSGLKVYSLTGVEVAASSSASVSLSEVSAGVYILEIATAKGSVFKRVIKE